MGQKVSRTDFEWVYTDQPHTSRRKIILEKYPQIKKLYGCDPNFKWIALLLVLMQISSLFLVRDISWPLFFLASYCIGATINHALIIAIHESGHNLAFGHQRLMYNRIMGFICNLPIGLPMSMTFRKYHVEHHRYQGNERQDLDMPTLLEAQLFDTSFGKLMWICLQPFFHLIRPFYVNPKKPTLMEIINFFVQLLFNVWVIYFFGWKCLLYLILATILGLGLHPVAGHNISDHYMFIQGFETYSYYGPLNWLTFNYGYHNEHHDFPAVPFSRLPEVKKIAAEFYDDMPHHTSWLRVFYDFIINPAAGPYARVKRRQKGLTT